MYVLGIIPVRLASQRLNEKALVEIEGKPLVVHTYLNAKNLQNQGLLNDLVVATDSLKILEVIKHFDASAKVLMTPSSCRNGVERISSALQQIPPQKPHQPEVVVNIQGDEPMFSAQNLRQLLSFFSNNGADDVEISTLAVEIDKKKALNPNIVKVVFSQEGRAIYFSRALIPYNRDEHKDMVYFKHLGIYAYKRSFLEEKFPFLPPIALEDIEKIEQLRFLGAQCHMFVGVVQQAGVDVNVREDVDAFTQFLQKKKK